MISGAGKTRRQARERVGSDNRAVPHRPDRRRSHQSQGRGDRAAGADPGDRLPVPGVRRRAGGALRRRRSSRGGALSCGLRVHIGVAGFPGRPPGRRAACADGHARRRVAPVPAGACRGQPVRTPHRRCHCAAERFAACRGFPVRGRHATGRRLRLWDPVHGRRRQQPHVDHPCGLHRRIGDRDPARAVVVRPAAVLVGRPGPGLRTVGGPGHPVRRIRGDLCPDPGARAKAARAYRDAAHPAG